MRRRQLLGLLAGLLAAGCLWSGGRSMEAAGLRVATFSCDATPPVGGHPLIWVVPVKEVETPLWAKGIVIEDGSRRYVLCAMDWCGLCNSSYELFCRKMAAAVGTDAANVSLHCVHQHTAPYTDGDAQRILDQTPDPPRYVDFDFLEKLSDGLAQAAAGAVDRLEPFNQVGTGQAKVERVASSRRLLMPDGRLVGRMSSCKDPEIRALPEGRIDPYLRTITLARDGRPLVRLHFYATHPQTYYGDPRASSDMPGFARERLEKEEGAFQLYFTGCAGDVAMGKYNDGSPQARDELTERLYEAMRAAAASTQYRPVLDVSWRHVDITLPVRDDPGRPLEKSRAVASDPKGNVVQRIRAATHLAFAARADRPLPLNLLELDGAAILMLPGECMVEYQLFAASLRPDRFVAVAAYSDLGPGYICTEESFEEGGYEPGASRVAPESERIMKVAIGRLLGQRPERSE
ncbi:MAG TPA: hypothetical protein EYP56_13885 [Planctomycetaceae bacterium]|nr:hypothetical protein [Planctomycetaceae bacterium]HIQ23170.1 hypothetical protein [Planctomycetota bacterium]